MQVTLSADLAARVAAEAERRGMSVEDLVVEVLDARLPRETPEPPASRRRLAFAGMGASTSGRTAAETEEMLAEGFGRDDPEEEQR